MHGRNNEGSSSSSSNGSGLNCCDEDMEMDGMGAYTDMCNNVLLFCICAW